MSPKLTGASAASAVDAFLAQLEHPRKAEISALRALILGVDGRVCEAVKWNAPSFYITEHFATFKLRPTTSVQIVLHTGAKVKPKAHAIHIDDPMGLLTWPAQDRCVATFADMREIKAKQDAFVRIVQQWIERTSEETPGAAPGSLPLSLGVKSL